MTTSPSAHKDLTQLTITDWVSVTLKATVGFILASLLLSIIPVIGLFVISALAALAAV